ncbi:hypothetical protein BJ138DRAFT_1085583 [Hygrophoropsis aurantiaca]|uniref:Uncharacterized protein n=1 Tax=Hygrophoropsis aurantiaca TaxID=72124 RepID=A0ACB8AFG9_9AGAM|nr:hypothetical protein BJ138DRAFT_1085583 [Hygrophoropsis aurantiaca]
MDAREDLPRISFESLQDWNRVQNNLATALRSRLNKELDDQGLPRDEDKFLPHINQFLDSISEIARPNLRINGRNYEDLPDDEDEFEQFDEALDRHIWSLSDQRLRWDKEVANYRRSRPREIETMLQQNIALHSAIDSNTPLPQPDDLSSSAAVELNLDVAGVFDRSASLASQLLQSISSQHERAGRMKSVTKEVMDMKP